MHIQNNIYNSNNKFNPNFEKLGKIVLEGAYERTPASYRNRLLQALKQNPQAVDFFEKYDADVHLNGYFMHLESRHPHHEHFAWYRTDMSIKYKHPLYPNRPHLRYNDKALCPYYYEEDTAKFTCQDGCDLLDSFERLEKNIKDSKHNMLSDILIREDEKIQNTISAYNKRLQIKKDEYDKLSSAQKFIYRNITHRQSYRRIKNYENSELAKQPNL